MYAKILKQITTPPNRQVQTKYIAKKNQLPNFFLFAKDQVHWQAHRIRNYAGFLKPFNINFIPACIRKDLFRKNALNI